MGIAKLDHYSIRTSDIQRSAQFYVDVLDFFSGPRPPFNSSGVWLYSRPQGGEPGHALVHLTGIAPGAAGVAAAATGTGPVDHIAFRATRIDELYARLRQYGIGFRERAVPDRALHQLFVEDPDGLMIELNYAHPDDIAAGARSLAP
jgi:catechol 2,3-dioxygenase-like lactoylglutathione lyase family enzyme